MADEINPDAIDLEAIRDAFTSRELGMWEQTVGVTLPEFGSAYMAAMLSWWAAHQEGDTRTPDDFLDMSLGQLTPWMEKAVDRLGKPQTGGAPPSVPITENASESSPSSPISTPSPSPSLQT